MKKVAILVCLLLASVLFSCEKIEDPGLGTFQEMEDVIDMSKTNQYKESNLCRHWVLYKVMYERYVDGVLQSTEELTGKVLGNEFTLNRDHTIPFGNHMGTWTYSHNYLFTKYDGYIDYYEVVLSNGRLLHLKQESIPKGGIFTPFEIDKSGRHSFMIWMYKAQ